MATTFEKETTQGIGNATGTGVFHTKIELPEVRVFVIAFPEEVVYCNLYKRVNDTFDGSSLSLQFQSNIKNGRHFFTADSPIDFIKYTDSAFAGPSYVGIKNGKGYVDITFDRQAGTLSAHIFNVDLVREEGYDELNLNVTIEASGLEEVNIQKS